jgi:DNA-binding transcriptional LysR family regulator
VAVASGSGARKFVPQPVNSEERVVDDGEMQLRHLETFLAIVDSGTLTAAATRLFKTQAAVSQDLKALETGLGLELVDRSGQRVQLTPAGLALVPLARRLLGEVADAQTEMARIRAGEFPVVRIACLPSVALRICQAIADFSAEHPDVRWSLITSLRGAMVEGLRTAQFDLAICEAKTEEDITNIPLAREPLMVVLSDSHPLAQADVVTPQDLAGVPYIGLARGLGATIEAQRFFASGDTYPAPAVEVNDTRLVVDLVARLNGFGILPVSALPGGPPWTVVPTDPPLVRQLSVAHLTGRRLSATVLMFTNDLTDHWPDA